MALRSFVISFFLRTERQNFYLLLSLSFAFDILSRRWKFFQFFLCKNNFDRFSKVHFVSGLRLADYSPYNHHFKYLRARSQRSNQDQEPISSKEQQARSKSSFEHLAKLFRSSTINLTNKYALSVLLSDGRPVNSVCFEPNSKKKR